MLRTAAMYSFVLALLMSVLGCGKSAKLEQAEQQQRDAAAPAPAPEILPVTGDALGPTKEETKKFLMEKCAVNWLDIAIPEVLEEGRLAGSSPADGEHSYVDSVSFDGDRYVCTSKCYTTSTGELSSKLEHSGNLADLNPNQVTTYFNEFKNLYSVHVEATGLKEKLSRDYTGTDGKRKIYTSTAHGVVDGLDKNTAAQVNKALKHLITISGGKGELFEGDPEASDIKNFDSQRSSMNKTGSNAGAARTTSPSPNAGKDDSRPRATKEINVIIPKTIIPKAAKVSWAQRCLQHVGIFKRD